MNFMQLLFLPFFAITVLLNYIVPSKYRYWVIFFASYIFYGYGDWKLLTVLATVTLLTYFGGYFIGKYKKRSIFRLFFWANLAILFVLKYSDFALVWIDFLASKAGNINIFSAARTYDFLAPIGLSFYIFQSTSYLNDIYRNGMEVEKNPIRYAAYVSFFPVILSGPIQKSREFLPQLKERSTFQSETFIRAFMLFLWGYLEKVLVSNRLKEIVDACWSDWSTQTGVYPLVGSIVFSLYIYCDFSAYSDMACAVSRMLGFEVKNNFKNPYMATTLSQFWKRWHMTLNDWFIENVYIPLGGNRKGTIRKYINVMLVFIFSGLWHGAAMHYIIWGGVNGLLHIMGQILSPLKKKVYKCMGIDENCFSIRILKRTGVFTIITFTWIFFRAPGTSAALFVIKSIFKVRFIDFFNQDLLLICGDATKTFLCILITIIFIIVQVYRKDASKYYNAFRAQPIFVQTLFAGFIIMMIIMASTAGNADVNTQFIYFQF